MVVCKTPRYHVPYTWQMELPITLSWNSVLQILSYKLASPLTALSTALFLLCWFSVNQFSNPVHAIRIKASYMSLWNLTALLYLRPSKTPHTEPSVMTPDSMQMSFNPASWNLFPIIPRNVHMVWNTSILKTILSNLSACFHFTSGISSEPARWLRDIWQRMPDFDSCQFIFIRIG